MFLFINTIDYSLCFYKLSNQLFLDWNTLKVTNLFTNVCRSRFMEQKIL